MNSYTAAARMNKEAIKAAMRVAKLDTSKSFEEHYDDQISMAMKVAEVNMNLAADLHIMWKKVAETKGLYKKPEQKYFITVRPDTAKVSFRDFYALVSKFVARACFQKFALSFEQKGTSPESLGQGFHVHIVADMKQRSKGEVLRDTISTFKDCTAPNCVQVDTLKNDTDVERVYGYLVDYSSNDDHKMATKSWDEMWRVKEGLEQLYEEPLEALSSPMGLIGSPYTVILT